MLVDLWMLTRTFTSEIGSAPSPEGPPPRIFGMDIGSAPSPEGPPPR